MLDPISLPDIEDYIPIARTCADAALLAIRQLPKVDKDGNSECPFAEELYARKEEAVEQVKSCLRKLYEYANWIEEQLGRCRQNASILSSGKDSLHTERPQITLSEAEQQQLAFCKRLESVAEKIEQTCRELEDAIREASQKEYPTGKPSKYPYFKTEDDSSEGTGETSSDLLADDNLKNIIDMGPSN